MLILTLSSLADAGSTVNKLLRLLFGNSYALELWGNNGFGLVPACESEVCDHLFSETNLGISAGYLIVVGACLPLMFTDFSNLMWFQYVAMTVTVTAAVTFVVTCFLPSPDPSAGWHTPPALGDSPGFAISTCFLSYAICFAVPSWWNESELDCPAPRAINMSVAYTTVVYYLPIALFPAFAFSIPAQGSALDLFLDPDAVNPVCVCAAYFLAILGIMPNVIAYSVAMRDNLQALGNFFTFKKSFFMGCIFPLLVAWNLDDLTGFGAQFQFVIDWSSIGILGITNFIVPQLIILKLSAEQPRDAANDTELIALPKEASWTSWEHREAKVMLILSLLLVVVGYALMVRRALE